MRLLILATGRARSGPEAELTAAYGRRLRWPLDLVEVEEKRPLPPARRIASEGALMLARLPDACRLIALDSRGTMLTSEGFAGQLQAWQQEGCAVTAFAIGGADGLCPRVLARADLVLSFGSMTWPHLLVRPMLAEQIYRAESILAGHPYHRA